MRLFLLPISTRRALIYCQRATTKPASELSYIERATKKAADTWASFEQAEGGWRKNLVYYGNRGMKRIPYEEWGLKSFTPLSATVQANDMAMMSEGKKYEVHFPANIMKQDDVPLVMARLAKERKQLHWSRFVWSLIAMPFTVPFALIPVIPNIPFFYVAFRCWSHWRALKGSDHLDFILDHRIFKLVSTPGIENVYKKVAPDNQNSYEFVTASQVEAGIDPKEQMLLTASSHSLIAKTLAVPELSGEVDRAVWQVQESMRKAEEQQATTEKQQSESPVGEEEKTKQ